MNFKNMHVATKLWLAVGTIVVVLAVVLGFSAWRLIDLQEQADSRLGNVDKRVAAASTWAGLTEANAARTVALIAIFDPSVEERLKKDIADTSAKISAVQKAIESMELDAAEKAQMGKIGAHRKAMIEVRNQAQQAKGSGDSESAMRLINEQYVPAVAAYVGTLRELVTLEEKSRADQWRRSAVPATGCSWFRPP